MLKDRAYLVNYSSTLFNVGPLLCLNDLGALPCRANTSFQPALLNNTRSHLAPHFLKQAAIRRLVRAVPPLPRRGLPYRSRD
jgi:hypothetical protein